MKSTTRKGTLVQQLTVLAKRHHAWLRIVPASQARQQYTGVIRHIGSAY